MSKKKFIKRKLKKKKMHCTDCKSRLRYHREDMEYGLIHEYFACINEVCGKVVLISRDKSKNRHQHKNSFPDYITKPIPREPEVLEQKYLIFELSLAKLEDRYYDVGEERMYNPIKKTFRRGDKEDVASEVEHESMLSLIHSLV